jgi:hypothetical protein
VDESDVLVPDDFNLIDQSKPTQIVPKLLLRESIIQPPKVHIPAGIALRDRQRNLRRDRGRFAPADLELLPVQGKFLNRRVRVERSCNRPVEEGEKDAGFLGENADGFERAKVHEVEQLVDGRGRGKVAHVDGAPCRVVGGDGR